MRRILYIAIFSTLTLSGCGTYTSYQREATDQITDDLYAYIEATSQSSSLSSLSWRELFTDPYLGSLIEQALERNTDLRSAQLSVEQAQVALSTARKAFLPSVGGLAQSTLATTGSSSASAYSVGITAGWEVDIFGKLRNAKMQAAAALEQSEAYRQAVQTGLVATLANSYFSLLLLDEQLSISEATKANWEANLSMMESMLRAGRINETSLLQSQASSVALDSSIVTLKEQIAQLENSISQLLALPTATIERGTLNSVELPEQLSVGMPLELLSSRPDVRVAESYLAQCFYVTAEARSSLYPSITLTGSAALTGGDMLYSLVGSLVQPIFYSGSLRAQVKISEKQQEQALLAFQQAIVDAGVEVNNALSECQSAKARLEYSLTQVELLGEAATKTELLMKHGMVTSLDVLTAQLSLLQSELSQATEQYNYAQGVVNLYRALGGGSVD